MNDYVPYYCLDIFSVVAVGDMDGSMHDVSAEPCRVERRVRRVRA